LGLPPFLELFLGLGFLLGFSSLHGFGIYRHLPEQAIATDASGRWDSKP
jgi:hypothetical protein